MSRFLGNLFTLFVPFCFLLSITAGHPEEENDDAKEKLLLTVVRIEQEYAHLSWFSNVPSRPGLVKCEVVCRPENKESRATEIKNSLPTNWTLLELPELHNNTKYSVFIVCSLDTEVYRSNVVHFVTGIPLTTQVDKKVFKESHHHKNFPVPEAIHESQVTDVVLGVLSGVFGAVITFVSAFYLWKKYQRRQRVLRFYREATEIETNPFGVIQVYFDDATTNSNIGTD